MKKSEILALIDKVKLMQVAGSDTNEHDKHEEEVNALLVTAGSML